MNEFYTIQGPATIGNCFGSYGFKVPEGKFAVVSHGEYSNGGHGPSQAGPRKLYDSLAEAEAAATEVAKEQEAFQK